MRTDQEEQNGNAAYVERFGTTGCTREAGVRAVCLKRHPHPYSVGSDGLSVPDRRYHLLHRAGDPELYRKCAGDGSADLRQLVLLDPGVRIGGAHCTSHLSQDCQMGRCRSSGANHRIRQFRDGASGGIPEGRTGIRYRLQDLHYRRTGNIVWNFFQLGVGTFFMGVADVRNQCRLREKDIEAVISMWKCLLFCKCARWCMFLTFYLQSDIAMLY